MIRFLQPEWLWLLALLPLALLWRGRRGPVAAVEYSDVGSRPRSRPRRRAAAPAAGCWLLPILAGALMIVGLARPQLRPRPHDRAPPTASTSCSGSMSRARCRRWTSKWTAARSTASMSSNRWSRKFIDERPNDRIGIVAFAGAPYLVSPLTLDHDWLQQNLERVQTAGVEDGTAIGSAIAASVNRLRDDAGQVENHDPAHRRREQHRQDLAARRGRGRQGAGRKDLHHRRRRARRGADPGEGRVRQHASSSWPRSMWTRRRCRAIADEDRRRVLSRHRHRFAAARSTSRSIGSRRLGPDGFKVRASAGAVSPGR